MIFHSDKKTVLYPKLFIDNIEIERVDYFNFLDFQLHHILTWNKQLSCISLMITKTIGLLHKLKSEYPTSILKSIYNTLILPNINYFILSWGSQIDTLYLLQKRAIRNISKSDFRAHTEPLFKERNLLKVQDIYHLANHNFYSKLINDNLPNYFESFIPQFSAGHQHYNFRNPSRLLPKIKHEFPKQYLRYKIISTINKTSNKLLEMAKTLSQKNFMNFIKNEIVTGYSYTCELLICHVCKRT